ncbi:MAG: hypothetical protein AB2A00_34100 [Myxococcota bacterium]
MTSAHTIYPHQPPVEIAPGIWQVAGSLPFPLPRSMTIVKLPSGGLLLYSVVAMHDEGMRKLEALGKPEVMVVPHAFHIMDAPFFKARYPDLKVVALPDAAQRLAGKVSVDGGPDQLLTPLGIRHRVVPGLKHGEIMLDLDAAGGRALVFTDVIGNVHAKGLLMKLLSVPGGGAGLPRIVRFRQVAKKAVLKQFLLELAETPQLKLLLGAHGDPIRDDPAGVLRKAAGTL